MVYSSGAQSGAFLKEAFFGKEQPAQKCRNDLAFVYQYGIVQFHRLDSRPNMSATRVQLGFNLSEPGPDLVLIWALQAQFAPHVGA